jgi:hypothetical protein
MGTCLVLLQVTKKRTYKEQDGKHTNNVYMIIHDDVSANLEAFIITAEFKTFYYQVLVSLTAENVYPPHYRNVRKCVAD